MPGNGTEKKVMPGDAMQGKAAPVKPRLTREQIARRAAQELADGAYVNLGWGHCVAGEICLPAPSET